MLKKIELLLTFKLKKKTMRNFYRGFAALGLLTLGWVSQLNAQAFWGVYGGINNANVLLSDWKDNFDQNDQKPTFESIRRLSFGVNCELPLSKYFLFQPEIAFTQKGTVMKQIFADELSNVGLGNTYYNSVNNIDLNYLQVPLLMKVRWQLNNPKPLYPNEGTGRPWFLELYAGPTVNYLLMAKSNYSQTIAFQNAATNIDTAYKVVGSRNQTGLNKLDISATMGLNLKWKVSKKVYLWADARYNMNFININDSLLVNFIPNKEGTEGVRYIPTLKNAGNLSFTLGISTTFTKRRYWNHPRMNERKF